VLGRRRFDQLLKALSMVYGIEPYVVLKDIWDCNDREVEEIARWMLDALIDAALRQVPGKAITAAGDGATATGVKKRRPAGDAVMTSAALARQTGT